MADEWRYQVCPSCRLSKFHIREKVERRQVNAIKPNAMIPFPIQPPPIIVTTTQVRCDNCKTVVVEKESA